MKRRLLWASVALLVPLLALVMCLRNVSTMLSSTATVEEGDIEDSVLAAGTLESKAQVNVGAQASGQIKSVAVRVGDRVKKGQLLAEIDPAIAENELKRHQARVQELLANKAEKLVWLNEAALALRMQRLMLASDATSRHEYIRAAANYRSQKAQMASIEASIRSARLDFETCKTRLSYTRIVAPRDGEVVTIFTKAGQTVNATQEAPVILKLADLGTMTVNARISEADVHRVRIGQIACVSTLGQPEMTYCGNIRSIESVPQGYSDSTDGPGSTSAGESKQHAIFYNALFDVPNAERNLRIAMTAQVHVLINAARSVPTIPVGALGPRLPSGNYEVRVVDHEGTMSWRSVRIGLNNYVRAQVVDGLTVGEKVVLEVKHPTGSTGGEATPKGA